MLQSTLHCCTPMQRHSKRDGALADGPRTLQLLNQMLISGRQISERRARGLQQHTLCAATDRSGCAPWDPHTRRTLPEGLARSVWNLDWSTPADRLKQPQQPISHTMSLRPFGPIPRLEPRLDIASGGIHSVNLKSVLRPLKGFSFCL